MNNKEPRIARLFVIHVAKNRRLVVGSGLRLRRVGVRFVPVQIKIQFDQHGLASGLALAGAAPPVGAAFFHDGRASVRIARFDCVHGVLLCLDPAAKSGRKTAARTPPH
ncbi:hypothetical protein [Chromobacterium haemolyticum]|uniref:hypothetical protein n=1 Tax=Chromobacterium haemolyticum TaxID=394935 RepID=UPI0009D92C27|nr:hypothetical protein [Chromobacterium haemolyticum]OQS42124.1 hypothetical protein B0T39_06500 [Chromobacterium haemolyticum]